MLETYTINKHYEVVTAGYTTPLQVLEEGDTFFNDLYNISKLLDAEIQREIDTIEYNIYHTDVAFNSYERVRSCIRDVKAGSVKCEEIDKDVLRHISNLIQANFIRCEAVFDFDPKEAVGYVFEGSKYDIYSDFKAKRSSYSDIDLKCKISRTLTTIGWLVLEGKHYDGSDLKNLELLDEVGDKAGDFKNIIKFADINHIECFNAKRSKQEHFYNFVKFYQVYKLIKVLLHAHSKELTLNDFYENILFAFDNHKNIKKFKTEIRKVFLELN